MITFEEAQAAVAHYAKASGAVWFDHDEFKTRERPEYWYFPYCFIGSSGLIVCKSSGRVTPLGSALRLEDWLWGYERHFLADDVTLRLLAVHDLGRTLSVLNASVSAPFRRRYEIHNWLRSQLQTLPVEFRNQSLALAIPRFREAERSGWFDFQLEPEPEPRAPASGGAPE